MAIMVKSSIFIKVRASAWVSYQRSCSSASASIRLREFTIGIILSAENLEENVFIFLTKGHRRDLDMYLSQGKSDQQSAY